MAPLPSSMKAIQIPSHGGVDILQHNDVPIPSLSEGQVLVKNHYCGVNYIDTYVRSGLYKVTDFPYVLGREGAGEVVAAHSSVKDLKIGTKVTYLCEPGNGSYCQYTAIAAKRLVALPEGISTKTAAAALLQGLTAWTLIRVSAKVQSGQWTLVHAAAGGVGLLLCQMLKSVGAKVIGVASTQEKLDLAKKNGAEWTLLSSDDKLVDKVTEITGGHGVDAIFDGVGKVTFQDDIKMIAKRGYLVSFGNASGAVDPVNILQLGPKCIVLLRPIATNYVEERDELMKYSAELFDMIQSGKLNIAIHDVYPLAESAKAHTDIESRKTTGKLLIQCN